jgi:hypothetical protein
MDDPETKGDEALAQFSPSNSDVLAKGCAAMIDGCVLMMTSGSEELLVPDGEQPGGSRRKSKQKIERIEIRQ